MAESGIERFLTAISYPDRAGVEPSRTVLRIDEGVVIAQEIGNSLRWTVELEIGETMLAELAKYVPGRIYKDEVTLAVGSDDKGFLWQEIPATTSDEEMKTAFEAFLSAVDWWRDRMEEQRADTRNGFAEAIIMP